jgi:hypothetical protein
MITGSRSKAAARYPAVAPREDGAAELGVLFPLPGHRLLTQERT